jgi:hypothetical protein
MSSDKVPNWRERNNERIKAKNNEKHVCECGGKYTYNNRKVHAQTRNHIKYEESKLLEQQKQLPPIKEEVEKEQYVESVKELNEKIVDLPKMRSIEIPFRIRLTIPETI